MSDRVTIDILEGPGDLDLFIHALRDGQLVQFTLDFPKRKIRCDTRIDGLRDISRGLRDIWQMEGKIETSPNNWVEFETALYSPKARRGQFFFKPPDTERHPVCFHIVPKGIRRCPECGADRMNVG